LSLFEILLLLFIALVVIGPEQLPEVLRTVGKIMRELRSASNELMREFTSAVDEEPGRLPPPSPPRADADNPKPSEPAPPAAQS
jgi:Tat protein translocase TatB subunit